MDPSTFFLDPKHAKDTGSPAFRQRYCEVRRIQPLHKQIPYVAYVMVPVLAALGITYGVIFHSPPPPPNQPEPAGPKLPWVLGTVIPAVAVVMTLVTVFNV